MLALWVSFLGLLASSLLLSGCANEPGPGPVFSLGDRLVLEVHYSKEYQNLPLTADDAAKEGWTVAKECTVGLGRRATSKNFTNTSGFTVWKGNDAALHLWFDKSGAVIGYGARAPSGVAEPWRKVGDAWEIDFLLRDPASACGASTAVANSVGDRFVMIGPGEKHIDIPLSLKGAFDKGYNDGGPCFPQMGWHMMYSRFQVSSPTPVYDGFGNNGGKLLALNLNSYANQSTPSYESPAPKEGNSVYGWHIYHREHKDACKNSATAALSDFIKTPANSQRGFECTPYFGNMWTMAPISVVDLHASGTSCKSTGGNSTCKFVNYVGPTKKDGYGTSCTKPEPTDGCHCYIQTSYTKDCVNQTSASTLSGKVDTASAFNSNGTLTACVGKVSYRTVVGWAPSGPGSKNLTSCKCDAAGKPINKTSAFLV